MLKAIRITTEGMLETIEIDSRDHGASINAAIGSERFDVVNFLDGIDVFVDDEGLFNSVLNVELTVIAQCNGFAGTLFGAGVFLGVDESTGETLGLTPEQLATVTTEWTKQRGSAAYLRARFRAALLSH